MRFHLRLFFGVLPLLILASCATEAPVETPRATEGDVKAINHAGAQWVTAAKANDAEGLLSLYTESAALMPPNQTTVEGSEAVRAWIESFLDQVTIVEASLAAEEVVVVGDWAFRRGTFSLTLSPVASSEPVQEAGKFIEVWQRQVDGSWKIARDIWNSSLPNEGR